MDDKTLVMTRLYRMLKSVKLSGTGKKKKSVLFYFFLEAFQQPPVSTRLTHTLLPMYNLCNFGNVIEVEKKTHFQTTGMSVS